METWTLVPPPPWPLVPGEPFEVRATAIMLVLAAVTIFRQRDLTAA